MVIGYNDEIILTNCNENHNLINTNLDGKVYIRYIFFKLGCQLCKLIV
jgi:hypothetical protein